MPKYFLDTGIMLLEGMSARNMGKNDLWIAATASVLKAKLLTTDRDFDHLDSEFLEVIYIDTKASYKTVD
jgi:predicted nucleic acid-binding protein